MKPSTIWFAMLAFFGAAVANPAHAQSPGDAPPVINLRAGIAAYGTGSDDGCTDLAGAAVGASARTPGRWFATVSGDVYLSAPMCTDELAVHHLPDGRWYAESGAFYLVGPRLNLRGGRTLAVGGITLAPATGVGAAYSFVAEGSRLAPWTGFSLGISCGGRFGVELEHGWHWVEIERTLEGATSPYETLRRAVPATQGFVTFRP